MRVLVVTTPGWGHIAPMLPVAEELQSRGHEVRWVTAADSAATLAAKGFAVRPTGMTLAERAPRARALLAERGVGVPPGEMRAHAFTVHFALLATPSTLEGVAAEVTTFRPDVIVREPAELSAAMVGRREGLPVVTAGFGGIVPAAALRMADEALASHLEPIGLAPGSEQLHFGALYLHPMPASMDSEAPPAAVRRIRPPRAPLGSEVPAVLAGFGADRPGVYGTFGTEFGVMAPWPELLEALGTLDVDALVTTGAAGLPDGATVPPNVRVAPFVDQALVLDRSAVVVSHAGSGSLLGAAGAGVPQVCIPLGADQFENAAAAARRGIAVRVDPPDRRADVIATAVSTAMTDEAIAAAAHAVAAEIRDSPDVTEAAGWIENLAASH